MKATNKNRNWSLILTSSLSLAGQFDRSNIVTLAEKITCSGRYVCSCHVVHAAQYLYAEVVSAGSSLSRDKYSSSRTSMVLAVAADIPKNLVETLNWMSKTIVINAEDVRAFMNATKKKYYGTSVWPVHQEEEEDRLEGVVPSANSEELGIPIEPDTEVGVEEDELEYDAQDNTEMMEIGAEIYDEASDYEPESSDSKSAWEADVGDTDPALLHKYFLVQGSMLMSLFRFCPECGHRLRKAQLKAVGTAAVVRFVCSMCVRPAEKKWESQKSTVAQIRERGYKGNLVGALSAVTIGLQYVVRKEGSDENDVK
ncbi:hypothetical protein OSTOST_04979, partial [Ostertagia ostertagi]